MFTSTSFVRSDGLAVEKPPAGPTCPNAGDVGVTIEQGLTTSGGAGVFTPVPANQTDTSPTGYFIARSLSLPANFFSVHRVTRDAGTGNAVIQNPGPKVTVGNYAVPANAPQFGGSSKTLDTLDARPTQAVSALDPANGNQLGLWTQHTVAGGGGRSEVRWYEIDPVTRTLIQEGEVSTSRFNFNAAISPDRAVNGAVTSGGDAMVLGYTSSSSTVRPQLRMVSKIGAAAQSAEVVVRNSPGAYVGFDCAGADNDCRWGDYSGATPDPRPPVGDNRVWLVNQYASGGTSTAQANWLTWNWVATP